MISHRIFTLLGTGSSGGVPRVGNDWGLCDPANPKNRRRRCALLVEQFESGPNVPAPYASRQRVPDPEVRSHGQAISGAGKTTVLVDAGADMREQLLSAGVRSLEGVVLTHAHADHVHGLDDLRQLAINLRRSIDVYVDEPTAARVMTTFGYCFAQAPGSSYPAFCTEHRIEHPTRFDIEGPGGAIPVQTLMAEHGDITALGLRIGDVVYLPDIKRIHDAHSEQLLQGVSTLIIDALRHSPHPTHLNLAESLAFIEQVAPARAILTNMHCDMDYDTLCRELPVSVEPGFDGMIIEC